MKGKNIVVQLIALCLIIYINPMIVVEASDVVLREDNSEDQLDTVVEDDEIEEESTESIDVNTNEDDLTKDIDESIQQEDEESIVENEDTNNGQTTIDSLNTKNDEEEQENSAEIELSQEEIDDIRSRLNILGFTVKGDDLVALEQGIKDFQVYYGLVETGVSDQATLDKIDSILSSPLQNGKRHKDTVQLKKDLAWLGFTVPGRGTTLYGNNTTQKVKDFQSFYGLIVNGIADEVTLAKIAELKNGPLYNRMHRQDVKELKVNLGKLGFPVPGRGTTLFGAQTEKKVKEFQAYYGLEVTGVAGDVTIKKITDILASPLQNGKRHKDTVQLKKDLAWLDFKVPGKGTTLYGKDTTRKVKDFQSFYGLVVNGIADEVTLAKIEELKDGPLYNKMRRQDVKTLKANLDKLGFTVPGKGTTLFGKQTEKKVKDFQSYYGLEVTGVVDDDTLKMIDKTLSSPLSNGERHPDTVQLKKDLASLGFPVPGNGTTYYGTNTTKAVKQLQGYYGLAINGIADTVTLNKIKEVLSSPLQNGKRHKDTIQLKKDLARLDFAVPGNGTNLYGNKTESKVREFQAYFGLRVNGIADEVTLLKINAILSSPLQNGKRHKDTIKLKKDLAKLGYKVSNSPTTLYGTKTETQVKKFQTDHGLRVSGIADPVTLEAIQKELNRSIRIFIDPGHGGHDSGASGYGVKEKDVALDIALRTSEYLTKKYLGVEIKLSRSTDKFVELEERARMANEWNADYFVSIHHNAFNGQARGFESYIHNGKVSNTTKQKQKDIHDYLAKELGVTDRGKKSANFSVLRNTNMPAILLEFLFIDNIHDNRLLGDPSYRSWLGQITADAIAYSFNLSKK